MTLDFTFHRPQREAQVRGFELAKDAEYWAHFWDPRVGKTQEIYDEWRYNVMLGRVTALVVIAYPADVHLVWMDEAIVCLPPEFLAKTKLLAWRSAKMRNKAGAEAIDALLAHNGPVVLTMNCEAILTDLAYDTLRKLFARHRVMVTVDEDWATNWSARTKRLLAIGRSPKATMRRLLTGTPADEGPHDLYFPTTFLKPGSLGFLSPLAFRNYYTIYEEGYNHNTSHAYRTIKGYRNLEELQSLLSKFSDRAIRSGSQKAYQTRYFTMTDAQRRVYDSLRNEYAAELEDGGAIRAENALLRLTRLQMVVRNFYPPERTATPCTPCFGSGFMDDGTDCESCAGLGAHVAYTELRHIDPKCNPAADALAYEIRTSRQPFVVWCRFIQDVNDAFAAARSVTKNVGRYDGTIPTKEREEAYHAFRRGELDGLVATGKSGLSRGHDLRRARLTIYYSQGYELRDRRQTEDRTEVEGGDGWTDVVDLVATDTNDLAIIEALRTKRNVAAMVTGDPVRKWI